MFALSILPMTLTAEAQTTSPIKVTQEIDPTTTPLFSDLTNIAFAQSSPSSIDNGITARARPVPQPKFYALTIEIDYIEGQAPTQTVLDYMQSYYAKQSITITYDTTESTAIPLASADYDGISGISDAEFWDIEKVFNAGLDKATNIIIDSNGYYAPQDGVYTLPQKWVLFGTTVQGSANTVGYTYCVGTNRDLVAGNYIYIADKAADDWAPTKGVTPAGAEAVVLMHEFGHSIGICVVRAGGEAYCRDYYCVMSYLTPQNAGNMNQWYYCSNHWKTKNLDYYLV